MYKVKLKKLISGGKLQIHVRQKSPKKENYKSTFTFYHINTINKINDLLNSFETNIFINKLYFKGKQIEFSNS
jgi:hypothetical protein